MVRVWANLNDLLITAHQDILKLKFKWTDLKSLEIPVFEPTSEKLHKHKQVMLTYLYRLSQNICNSS